MSRNIRNTTYLTIFTLILSLFGSAQAQTRAYQVTDREVRTLLNSIEKRTDTFRMQVDRSLDRSTWNNTRAEDNINAMIDAFEQATDRLRGNFAANRSTSADVRDVLNRGIDVNRFVLNNRLSAAAETTWAAIRNDLNTLARYYNVTTVNWTMATPGTMTAGNVYTAGDVDVQALLNRIENRTDAFRRQIGRNLNRSNVDGTNLEDQINAMVSQLEQATNRLRDNFRANRSTSADVQEVLDRAMGVNQFMLNNQLNRNAENTWSMIRNDLNTLAGYYSVALADWNRRTPATSGWSNTQTSFGYTVSEAQMRTMIDRLRAQASAFRLSYNRWERTPFGGVRTTQTIAPDIESFERALLQLRNRFTNRNEGAGVVDDVFRSAVAINNFVMNNRVSPDVTSRWNQVRNDLNTLAGYYGVSNWDWNNPRYWGDNSTVGGWTDSGSNNTAFDTRLTGTYRLNTSLSDNVTTAVDRALIGANVNVNQRDRMRRNLQMRLTPPDTLVFEKRGTQVVMAASNGQRVTLNADGSVQTETSPNGRMVRTSVTTTDRDLTINYEGDRMNDYYISFMPQANGQLRVSRRVYLENQNETVTVTSVYDKVSPVAQWPPATGTDTWGNTGNNSTWGNNNGTTDQFIIPNSTRLTATLDTPLSARTARNGDRFTMTVNSPGPYAGAVIEGSVVGERSGIFTGRANMELNFETIRLNGRTYRFAGIVDQVRDANGNMVSVNNEGQIRDNSQTNRTITRAGIGAALGAIIGAIAGGGQGAAIGAGVGATAGAGTVVLQGRDNLELNSGTQFTITATAPANVSGIR